MKRLLGAFITLCLMAALLPFTVSVSAAEVNANDPINGICYDTDSIVISDFVCTPSDMQWGYYEKTHYAELVGLGATIKSPWDGRRKYTSYTLSFTLNSEKDFYFSLGYAISASNTNGYVAVDDEKYIELETEYVSFTRCISDSCTVPLSAGSHVVTVNFTTVRGDNGNRSAFLYDVSACTLDHKTNVGSVVAPTCTEDGYTEHACPTCGLEWADENVEHLGHNFENGVCTRCGGIEMEREEDGTYLISSAAQLDDFSRIVNEEDPSAKAKLVNDIVYNDSLFGEDGSFDAENKDSFRYFTPIGTSSDFKGTFDGNGHTIGGLYIYSAEAVAQNKPEASYLGLVAKGAGATVCDLTLQDSYICGYQYVGGICGSASENTKIENCRVLSSQINGVYNIGGICGNALYATIRRCQNDSAVYAKVQAAGGILGNVADKKVTVEYCLNTGTLSGEDAGGIVGKTDFDVTIRSCLSLGTLSATGYVGNILGYYRNSAFVIENCAYLYESGNSVGGGVSSHGYTTDATAYTVSAMSSGKVAYSLNGDQSAIYWYQTIGTDKHPVLDSSHKTVYSYRGGYSNNPCSHSETEAVHYEPSCATEGYDAVVCKNCLVELERTNIVPQLGAHNYGAKTRICSICGDGEIPAGEGTSISPYRITNHGNVLWLSQYYNHTLKSRAVPNDRTLYAELMCDIDMNLLGNYSIRPIGTDSDRFIGVFEGNGYKIDRLKVSASENASAGLFGTILNAQIRNLDLVRANVKGNVDAGVVVGSVIGMAEDKEVLFGVRVSSSEVSGGSCVGGMIGKLNRGKVTSCAAVNVKVKASSAYCGGIVGLNMDGEIRNCLSVYPKLTCDTNGNTGGIVGNNSGKTEKCAAYIVTAFEGKLQHKGGIVASGSGSTDSYYYSSVGSDGFRTDATEKTKNAFSTGEVCYLLNDGVTNGSQVWYQVLTGSYPVPYPEPFAKKDGTIYKIDRWNHYSNTPTVWIEITDKEVTVHNLAACGYGNRAVLLISANGRYAVASAFDGHPMDLSSYGIDITEKTTVKAFLWYNIHTAKPIIAPCTTTVTPQSN